MAVHTTGLLVRPVPWPPAAVLERVRARLAAPALDARIAAGEDPSSDVALACRSVQLVAPRALRRLAGGLERLLSERDARAGLSAAAPVDRRAVLIARPALEQLAAALRSRRALQPRGVALAQALLTEPASVLYRPSHPEQLYEAARDSLLALGLDCRVAPCNFDQRRSPCRTRMRGSR